MKFLQLFIVISFLIIYHKLVDEKSISTSGSFHNIEILEKDTCIIEGVPFRMVYGKSKRIMKAYIKNSQLYVINDGLQFAKYRIIQYVFSSLTNEQIPSYRAFNQRLSPPVLKVLKNSRVGEQFIFEEIVIVDQQNTVLSNDVRPLMIERIKN